MRPLRLYTVFTGVEHYCEACPSDCPTCFAENVERAVERAIDLAYLLRRPEERGWERSRMLGGNDE
jgi:hypothetical protein